MGTNYYAVKSVDKEELKSKICSYIDNEKSFLNIAEELGDLINNNIKIVHIGKSSYGWKFIFNHNNEKYYKRNRDSIDQFIRENKLFDEYGKELDADEFWKLVDSKQNDKISGYLEFESDDLRFSEGIEFS